MEKTVSFVLALILLLSLCACGQVSSTPTPAPTPTSTPTPTPTPEITKEKAKKILSEYLQKNEEEVFKLLKKSSASYKEIEKIRSVKIASIDFKKGFYEFTVKGHFFGEDEYGKLCGTYNFDFPAEVSRNDGRVHLYFASVTK